MSKIIPVTDFERLKQTWNNLFKSNDPFAWPFQEKIRDYLLFYPTDGFALTKKQYNATLTAANKIGDHKFYFSVVECEIGFHGNQEFWGEDIPWLCENPDFKEYLSISNIPLECGLFSWNGKWGILISHEDHALIGGKREFIDILKKEYPDWRKDRKELFHYWKNNPEEVGNADWIKIFE